MGLQEQTFAMLLLQAFSYIPGGKMYIISRDDKYVWPKLCLSIRTDGYVHSEVQTYWNGSSRGTSPAFGWRYRKKHENFPVMAPCMSYNKLS
jgi:hypothetical protein